ncbi:hypothetical protein KDW_03460 [Dictyobacter vulcani]|uniref:Uncharacterized protein n=1 Tax=Dictyobacter vulcani TaxID=2607529 RepID=A0A5J4KBV9_9CHLR|nr:hypothetical protein [Dictyobacter vulcani]GER86184.1 hypothetical protein KDW_03460 [Dictyobacter vulcani]
MLGTSAHVAAQCIAPPSVHLVFPGKDGRFYPVRFLDIFEYGVYESILLDGVLVSFESHQDALTFCMQDARLLSFRLTYIDCTELCA